MKELISVLSRNNGILFLLLFCCTAVSATIYYFQFFGYASIILIVWCIITGVKLTRNVTSRFFLVFFMFTFFWITNQTGFDAKSYLLHVIPLCFVFILGHSLVRGYNDEWYIIGLLIVTALCSGLFNIYYSINDAIENGFINFDLVDYAYLKEHREEQGFKVSTLVSAELAPLLSCMVLLFIKTSDKETKKISVLGGFFSVIAALCVFHFVSRTAVVIVLVTLIFGITYRYKEGSKGLLGVVLALVIVIVLFFNSDIWTLFESRSDLEELKTGNGRTERMQLWWDLVLAHPFGTPNYSNVNFPFAHNFWLDFAKIAGWGPAIMLVLFSFFNVKDVFQILKNKHISPNVKLLVVSMMVGFLLAFSVEPIFEGAKMGMTTYFFFCGIVSALPPHYYWESSRIIKTARNRKWLRQNNHKNS